MVNKERGYQGKKLTLLYIYISKWTKNHDVQSTKNMYTQEVSLNKERHDIQERVIEYTK
jgi:hypothetical protein